MSMELEDSERQRLESLLSDLEGSKASWAKTTIKERLSLFKEIGCRVQAHSDEWCRVSAKGRSVAETNPLHPVVMGDEYMSGVWPTLHFCNLMQWVLEPAQWTEASQTDGNVRLAAPPKVKSSPKGDQKVACTFPWGTKEALLWPNMSAEVWMKPEKDLPRGASNPLLQGRIYANGIEARSKIQGVSLVLGAGNVNSIMFLDSLHKLFVDNEVVLLKLNPVNDYMEPVVQKIFQPLIDRKWLFVTKGGVATGVFLTSHPKVDSIHITGSSLTYDAIVWGVGEKGQENKAKNTPVNPRPISSELGCVTPWIVVPTTAKWSKSQLEYHARSIAGAVTNNLSFNCTAGKVLVTYKGWPQREEFLAKVKQFLSEAKTRKAYYPGAQQRYQKFMEKYGPESGSSAQCNVLVDLSEEEKKEGHLPWTLFENVPTNDPENEYCLQNEAFCPLIAEVALSLDGDDSNSNSNSDSKSVSARFLDKAIDFVNDKVWGNLSCSVILHPSVAKSKAHHSSLNLTEEAATRLRYGGIAFNAWSSLNYPLGTLTWGAYPENSPRDIKSGEGWVHNAFLFEHAQKSVFYAPFTIPGGIRLPYFAGYTNHLGFGKAMTDFDAKPSVFGLVKCAFNAFKG